MPGMIKVLIVDDEEEFASALAERLELRDMEASLAHDAAQAREQLQKQRPDVVLLDVLLPGESGLDVLTEIKSEMPDLPVLLLTGRGGERKDLGIEAEQAFCCLAKPVDIDNLLANLREALHEADKA